ncbi:MAG: protein translocase subunit SecDF [Bacteroidia bacterium]|nr:protein translocase subunit SecDF [Bacteroidia bacterium]
MQNKNTVLTLLFIFIAICAYNLYYTYVQFSLDGKISEAESAYNQLDENQSKWSGEDSATYDNFTKTIAELEPDRKKAADLSFTLGLDLQGGMFVTLEVVMEDLLKELAATPEDSAFQQALVCATDKRKQLAQPYIPLFIDCFKQINPTEGALGAIFTSEDLDISFGTTDDEVAEILQSKSDAALDRTFNIIRARIDQFGVVSPTLQKQGNTDRILLELPGVKDKDRVRELLRSTARLEFYTCYGFQDAFPVLVDVNEKMRQLAGLSDTTEAVAATDSSDVATAEVDSTSADSIAQAEAVADTTPDFASLSEEDQEKERQKFRRENPLFARLQQPNYQVIAQGTPYTPLVGYAFPTDTAKINEILKKEEVQALIPEDMRFVWSVDNGNTSDEGGAKFLELIAIRTIDGGPAMGGEAVSTARQDFDPTTGEAIVSVSMTSEGTSSWGLITQNNVERHIAILLDGYVYSFPRVESAITTGQTRISGSFTVNTAKDLANILEAGQLPVRARIEGEETVGPTLGEENIQSGLNSFLIAFLITLIFMGAYYAKAGLVANVALLANLLFILGCSAAFTIVLTLPGIAAIVLTVGMAVDANVLIFERIREELLKDKTLKASIKSGFQNAFSSVMDANITTFLTGVVLYAFGVGPIRGFAVSLMIGIVTSLIAALIISRLILDYYGEKGGKSMNFGFDWSMNIFKNVKLKMVERTKTMYIVSGTLIVLSLLLFVTQGFKTGVDFNGGRQFTIAFTDASGNPKNLETSDVSQIRQDLATAFENQGLVVKTLSSDNQLMVTTSYLVDDRAATEAVTAAMEKGVDVNYSEAKGWNMEVKSVSDVGPAVANDIKEAALYSVIFSLLIIFFYILIRFRKWQYSAGAIAALFHDVIITLGIFSFLSLFDNLWFNVEINQNFIAALLTIIGYSINDTVVVFDRIRENVGEMKTSNLATVYNTSIDQTISRTLITSFTTVLSAFILFAFGGDGINGFMFAIMIGVIIGTYSSIFVASPISLNLMEKSGETLEPAKA